MSLPGFLAVSPSRLRVLPFAGLLAAELVLLTGISASAQMFGHPHVLSNTVLNSDAGADFQPDTATDGAGNWVAVWASRDTLGGTIGTDVDILVSRSADGGATWSPPAALNTNAATDSGNDTFPRIATDGEGSWVVVWTSDDGVGNSISGSKYEVLVSRSTDGGATWSSPAALNASAATDPPSAADGGARIATDGAGNWVAVWTRQDHSGGTLGTDSDLLVARSTDAGATWTPPVPLNTTAATDSGFDSDADVKTDGAGNWVAAWTFNDWSILVARSTDNGATWTAPAALHSGSSLNWDVTLATDGAGHWLAAWASWDDLGGTGGGESDVAVSRSTDGGATWSPAAALSPNAASDTLVENSWPQVYSDGAGNWVAVWSEYNNVGGGPLGNDSDNLVSRSADNGASWTVPAPLNTNAATDAGADSEPQVISDGGGNWIAVWTSSDSLGGRIGTDGDILFSHSTDAGATWAAPEPLNSNATNDPMDVDASVATDGAGNWIAVWASEDRLDGTSGTDLDILVSRSVDNGATWTAPATLNSNAASDSGDDVAPRLTTDGAGNWTVVWQSQDSLGGTIGTDPDILVSRSGNNGVTWTAPAALNTNAASDSGQDRDPQVASDGAGTLVTVWWSNDTLGGTIGSDDDILVSHSTDGGATWTPPAALDTDAATDVRDDFSPQVATDGSGHWVAVWAATNAPHAVVLVSRSADNGATWTPPAAPKANTDTHTYTEFAPYVATDGSGNWVALWTSNKSLGGTNDGDDDIHVSRSTDNGATWSSEFPLNANAITDRGDDYWPRVTTDHGGTMIAYWFSDDDLGGTIGHDDDVLFARSTDGGATWSASTALNKNAATDSGLDYGPDLATDGAGHWVAAWQSNGTLGGEAGFGAYNIAVEAGGPPCESGMLDPSSCLVAPETKIQITDSTTDSRNKLQWQWSKGEAFAQGDLAVPQVTTDYALCVYDTSASVPSAAVSLLVPASAVLWDDKAPVGLSYKDKSGSAGPVTALSIATGADTKTRIKLAAEGAAIGLPGPAGSQYFLQDPRVVVQLSNTEGTCWTSQFSSGDAGRNTQTGFKASTR